MGRRRPGRFDSSLGRRRVDYLADVASIGLVIDARLSADDRNLWAHRGDVKYVMLGVEDSGEPLPTDFFADGLLRRCTRMTNDDIQTQPITGLPASGLPELALVVGDPARAERVAAALERARPLADHREYRSFVGRWRGTDVLVASHGVGAPGAVCLFQELVDGGVRRMMRFGTAGALQPGIDDGDLVIATACVRDDGVTHQMIPEPYPAVSDPPRVLALATSAQRHGMRAHQGIVWTRAAFYPGLVDLGLDRYVAAGVLAIDMELAALLVFGSLNAISVSGVCVIDGAAADGLRDTTGYDPHREVVTAAIDAGIAVALDALVADA